ncbi:YggU-like protein [Pleomassaria siparia CBS 279.74]|uniref:YggU-like protein n=1 Tax=Pleomassaria siparia CBS 279.74 TaxID=1314801 RepID=A0A6G1KFC2_9PLEO|nr:YggU-like protein [Pleomassaria siparia CBS 279.74]
MLTPAIRFMAAKSKAQGATIQLLCHVKPGASAKREGIQGVTDEGIELCVSAQAREGEANKAVREMIADILKVPKSDVEVAKGMKSRQKTVVISNIATKRNATPEEEIERIKILLIRSVDG